MKSFFQLSEQAKRHKRVTEAGEVVQPTATPVAGAATPVAAPAAKPVAAPAAQPAAPDYKTFGANWANFAKDPVNATAIAALGKTMPALATLGQEIQKLAAAPAPAPTK